MKIKLSKSQWEFVGEKAGWMKKIAQQSNQIDPRKDPSFQQALKLWNTDKKQSLALLQKISPDITEQDINVALQAKASGKKTIKEASTKSWLANMFAAALLAGSMATGAFGGTNAPPSIATNQESGTSMTSGLSELADSLGDTVGNFTRTPSGEITVKDPMKTQTIKLKSYIREAKGKIEKWSDVLKSSDKDQFMKEMAERNIKENDILLPKLIKILEEITNGTIKTPEEANIAISNAYK
jgi:hypothetical protein